MREIKFRAWIKSESRVVRVDEIGLTEGWIEIQGGLQPYKFGEFKLMQYTGLKDKNDVEIYEGDIVNAWGNNLEVKYIVDGFFAESPCGAICEAGQEWEGTCIVIGNIHQNPELLSD